MLLLPALHVPEGVVLHRMQCNTIPLSPCCCCCCCRHVLEYMVLQHMHHFPRGSLSQGTPPDVSQLASSHENVTILFTEWVCARCAAAPCACLVLKAEQLIIYRHLC